MKPTKYPHALIGVPRSLLVSDEWHGLTPTARLLFLTLLSYSNTETFRPVYPSRDTLARLCGVSCAAITQCVKQLESANLLKSFAPFKRRIGKDYKLSKVYEFTVRRFVNADLSERGAYPDTIIDYTHIESALPDEIKSIVSRLDRTEERITAVETVLDSWSKRVKIVSTNADGEVFADIHSPIVNADVMSRALPVYLRLLPTRHKKDIIVNSKATLSTLNREITNAHDDALRSARFSPLIELLKNVS